MEMFISVLGIIMTAFTSIVVAAIGYAQTKRDKNNVEYIKLKEENEYMMQEKSEQQRKDDIARFERIERSITKMSGDVIELKENIDMKAISNQLTQLHTLTEYNFEYIQSLSNAVATIGDTLTTSNAISEESKNSIKQDLSLHKSKEDDINKKLYKIIV